MAQFKTQKFTFFAPRTVIFCKNNKFPDKNRSRSRKNISLREFAPHSPPPGIAPRLHPSFTTPPSVPSPPIPLRPAARSAETRSTGSRPDPNSPRKHPESPHRTRGAETSVTDRRVRSVWKDAMPDSSPPTRP